MTRAFGVLLVQDFAEDCADGPNLRVIFISDGSALLQFLPLSLC